LQQPNGSTSLATLRPMPATVQLQKVDKIMPIARAARVQFERLGGLRQP